MNDYIGVYGMRVWKAVLLVLGVLLFGFGFFMLGRWWGQAEMLGLMKGMGG